MSVESDVRAVDVVTCDPFASGIDVALAANAPRHAATCWVFCGFGEPIGGPA